MEVYRISRKKYSRSLKTSGKAARWNKDNEFVLYTGHSRSLAALENVVHLNSISPADEYEIMIISLSDNEKFYKRIFTRDLPIGWRDIKSYGVLRKLGSDWYQNQQSLILQVPSALIPQEYNYIINTTHPDFKKENVSLAGSEPFIWDERLF